MRHFLLILIFLVIVYSCGQSSENKFENVTSDKKRPLKTFSESDVVKYGIAVLNKESVLNFEVRGNGNEFLVGSTSDSLRQYRVKIGEYGLLLYRDENDHWTDRFEGRRVLYYEQGNKLILSEIFDGDSTTYYEFNK